jgi:DNA-binding MarR family transcriptional regulator
MLAEQLESGFSELFKTRDLTTSQYNVLRILRGAGHQGRSCSEIGERMITRDSDITRMLDRLETRELIRRERQTDDRRIVLAFITPKGSALLKDLDAPVSELHVQQLDVLSEKELDKLIALAEKARKPRD